MQLDVAVEMNDFKLVINALNSIGLVYVKTKEYDKALEYFEKSLTIIEQVKTESFNLIVLQLLIKQNSLIGEAYLKLNSYEMARSYFEQQLDLSNKLFNQQENNNLGSLDEYALQEFINLLNLAMIASKSRNFKKSIEYNERCLENLQSNASFDLDNKNLSCLIRQQVLELYGRAYIGLVNGYLCEKDNLRAALFAHAMLDWTLIELTKVKSERHYPKLEKLTQEQENGRETSQNELEAERHFLRRFKYLKFIEMSACSKLAQCYIRQNRLVDAFKLHQREATLANQLNNTLYSTRA